MVSGLRCALRIPASASRRRSWNGSSNAFTGRPRPCRRAKKALAWDCASRAPSQKLTVDASVSRALLGMGALSPCSCRCTWQPSRFTCHLMCDLGLFSLSGWERQLREEQSVGLSPAQIVVPQRQRADALASDLEDGVTHRWGNRRYARLTDPAPLLAAGKR